MDQEIIGKTFQDLSRVSVWGVLERTAARLPRKTAVIDGDRRFSFEEIRRRSGSLAAGLRRMGLKKGSVAAVYMPNSVELIVLFYALQRLGVIVAWLNPSYREKEVRFTLENSGASALFLFDEWQGYDYLKSVLGLGPLPDLRHIVAMRHGARLSAVDDRVRTLEELLDPSAQGDDGAEEATPDDLSMLIYTSGTTGRPKGAMISQSQVTRAGYSYSLGVDATEDDIFIAFLPMCHSYGCGALLVQAFVLGATLAVLDQFAPERAFEIIQREKVTVQLGSPAHYIMELKHPSRAKYDLSSLRAGLIAGQIAPAGLISQVQKEMGIYISSFLGSSEVGPGLAIILPYQSPLETREKYIGYPLLGTVAKVVDPATDEEKEAGEPGELLLSGWHVTRGYWRNPEETARQIVKGWLHTGDIAARDADGCFRILGRIKEFINRGGLKIIPSEVESVLVQYPGVVEACVVGTPNPVLGESICACIKLDEGAKPLTLQEVRGFLEGKMAPFKLPDELLVVQDFPRLSGGLKVNRFGDGGVVDLCTKSEDKQVLRR